MKSIIRSFLLPAGFVLLAVSIAIRQLFSEAIGIEDWSCFISGMGAGLMFVGVIVRIIFKNSDNPEAVKQREIDEKDERNIRIKERAGYASWHATLLIFVVMAVVFIFMNNPIGYWLSAGAVVLHKLILLFFTKIYNTRM